VKLKAQNGREEVREGGGREHVPLAPARRFADAARRGAIPRSWRKRPHNSPRRGGGGRDTRGPEGGREGGRGQ